MDFKNIDRAKRVAIGFFLLLSAVSNAWAIGDGGTRKLESVRLVGDDQIAFEAYSDDFLNPDGCERSDRIVIQADAVDADQKLSVAMTALVADKRVAVWVSGCSNTAWGYTVPTLLSLGILRD
ncbi:hypothetical protein ACJJIQ_08655 [Microbulbifer sp. ANSA003]|uniref:hypothetical protein n=1 Tax=unclassified Microbulbifer TaxID=2619833 RepID=UPI00403B2365